MQTKSRLFEEALADSEFLRNRFSAVKDDHDVVSAMNYLLLSLVDYDDYETLLETKFEIDVNYSSHSVPYTPYTRVSANAMIFKLTIIFHDKWICIAFNSDSLWQNQMEYYHRVRTRLLLYASVVNKYHHDYCALWNPDFILGLLNEDLQEHITETTKCYVINNAEAIENILSICNQYQWNDLTAVILRICHDEGIIEDSEANLAL